MITVMSLEPDARGRFACCCDGWLEDLSLDQIKRAIAEGEFVQPDPKLTIPRRES